MMFFVVVLPYCESNSTISNELDNGIFLNGSYIMGGLFPIHYASNKTEILGRCNGKFNPEGFLYMEAMLFAIQEINRNDSLLPGIRLGVNIEDTCSTVDRAIRKSLNFSFIKKNIQNFDCPTEDSPNGISPTIAIVGASSSDIAMAVTNLAGLFYVPVVSFSASSRLLSNRIRFRYFLRTVASDSQMAIALVHLLQALEWNFVSVLYSDTDYGRSAMETLDDVFKSLPTANKICVVVRKSFTIYSKKAEIYDILEAVKTHANAKGIILFTTVEDTKLILAEFEGRGMTEYVFIGTDYLVGQLENAQQFLQKMLLRLIGVTPKIQTRLERRRYVEFNSENIINGHQWLTEYRQYKQLNGNQTASKQETPYIPYLLDAIYAVAHGLHHALGCTPKQGCKLTPAEFSKINRENDSLLKAIHSVMFRGFSREWVFFDSNGNSPGAYDILVFNQSSQQFDPVGSWVSNTSTEFLSPSNTSFLDLNLTRLRKHLSQVLQWTDEELLSVCARKCYAGHRMASTNDHQACCWTCVPCAENEISHSPVNGSCQTCPDRYWANSNHTKCEPVIPTAAQFGDAIGITVTSVASFGLISVIFVFGVFYVHWNTHLVRASSRLLCCVLLFGIALGYVTSILIFSRKTEAVCRVALYLVSVSFCLLVGTLLTKTNRIHRIFSKKVMRKGTPKCLADPWMLFFIAVLVVVEIVICTVIILTTEDGKLYEVIYIKHTDQAYLQCKFYATYIDYHMAIWWAYNSGIVIVCTYQAYLTRKVPGNYNEARFIALNMITIATEVIVFFLSYYGTRGFYKDILVSSFLLSADTITLGCIFIPKVYIILFRPEKNVAHGRTSLGTIDNEIGVEMRKVSRLSQQSFVSLLSTSSNGTSEESANQNNLKQQRKRKLSVFCGFSFPSDNPTPREVFSTKDMSKSNVLKKYTAVDGQQSADSKSCRKRPFSSLSNKYFLRSPNYNISRLAVNTKLNVNNRQRPRVSRQLSDISARSVHFKDEP